MQLEYLESKNLIRLAEIKKRWHVLFPGVIVCVIVAVTAQFLSEHYATPVMLLALLLGIAVSFLGEEGRTVAGVDFTARSLLRFGVALLGVRVSAQVVAGLGPELILLVIAGVVVTIAFGLWVARYFGHRWRFALLTAGSVAICGASAAVAISSVLPKDERSEERLIFTVVGVTLLSTVTMIAYPILVQFLSLDEKSAGIFIGGAIHDVAQVVGAGFTISPDAGETATLVKLIRVTMLAPVVLITSLVIHHNVKNQPGETSPPLIPGFILMFVVLATVNSIGWIPPALSDWLAQLSRWLLVIAIAAVGMKTNLKKVLSVGGAAISLMVLETAFLGIFVLTGIIMLK